MDKLSIAIFFLFFTLSFARTPLTQQENDITDLKLPSTLPEPDTTPKNQLDKEAQHVQENQDLLLQDNLLEPKGKKTKALPLTFVRLRPINCHFWVRSRRPSRLCHHHHFHHAHNLKPRTHSTHLDDQVPYGNKDMIVSSGENNDDLDHVMFTHGGMHQFPDEWMSFLHHNNDNEDDDEEKMSKFIIKRNNHDKFDKMKLKGQFYDPLDDDDDDDDDEDDKISAMQHEDHHSFDKKKMKKHLHHHHEEEEHEAEEGNEAHKEEKKTGGFVRHIRKFLDNYFD
ncbi:hypothetical protein RND71_016833 [Anisodus tanguticus]|uniref:Uncharacterized protein n=1 Tax=Anisodus tanguticus TaxID=243964 RepID=A0AAE1S8L4_9SOLA|nr:hypothetical protein RND71_016833 [Anisodus tanguticus]